MRAWTTTWATSAIAASLMACGGGQHPIPQDASFVGVALYGVDTQTVVDADATRFVQRHGRDEGAVAREQSELHVSAARGERWRAELARIVTGVALEECTRGARLGADSGGDSGSDGAGASTGVGRGMSTRREPAPEACVRTAEGTELSPRDPAVDAALVALVDGLEQDASVATQPEPGPDSPRGFRLVHVSDESNGSFVARLSTNGLVSCIRRRADNGLAEAYVAQRDPAVAARELDTMLASFATGDLDPSSPRFVQAFRADGDQTAAGARTAELFAAWRRIAEQLSPICVP